MKHICKIIFIVFLGLFDSVFGQDIHLTQFYAAPLYLNPAFAGANICTRASITYRNQWPGISKAYKSYLVSVDHNLQKNHLGIGLLAASDEAGTAQLKTTLINPTIAYELPINRTLTARFGIQPGVGIKSLNFGALMFGDQLAKGPNSSTDEQLTKSSVYFDAAAGALVYTSKYYVGVSLFHLNKPTHSFTGIKTEIPMKFSVQGGGTIMLSDENSRDEFKKQSVTFAVHAKGQSNFNQLDVGAYYNKYLFTFGVWYRGIPIIKSYSPEYSNNDALSFLIGLKKDRFNVGYSYDYTISKLSNRSNGAHELSITYQHCPPRKKIKPRRRVACAKF